MKGELTTTEFEVSAGCGNVPGGEDSRAGAAFQRTGAVFPHSPHAGRCRQTAAVSRQPLTPSRASLSPG